jgi:F-type H+-transporting ATPase subunit epsilon
MAKHTINFKIITPEKIVYSDIIDKVTIPTESGEITVLANHQPIVSILVPGEMRIQKDGKTIPLSVSTGFIEIRPKSEVYILADTAERVEDIDIKRVAKAKKRVEELMNEKQGKNNIDTARLQAILDKEAVRLKIANKYRKN